MQETISFAKYWAMTAGVVQPCTASMSIDSTLTDCPLAKLWHFSQLLNISFIVEFVQSLIFLMFSLLAMISTESHILLCDHFSVSMRSRSPTSFLPWIIILIVHAT